MTNSVAANLRKWDRDHDWAEDGDEWKGQARACGVSYEEWKRSVVRFLIEPYTSPLDPTLEIGPGHGRWSEALAEQSGGLVLVDLSPLCLDFCRMRFADRDDVRYHLTDGGSLPTELSGAMNLVWSFDSFVHFAPSEIDHYLTHIARVLAPGGMAVIHHANRRHWTLWFSAVRQWGPFWTRLYRYVSMGADESVDGWRSAMSAKLFARLARGAGLEVVSQISRWGPEGRHGVPRHNDKVTILRKPEPIVEDDLDD